MKFVIKLTALFVIPALACPLSAQERSIARGVTTAARAQQAGLDAAMQTSKAGVRIALSTSQAGALALRSAQELLNTPASVPQASISQTLEKRLQTSYRHAREIQVQYPDLFTGNGPMYNTGPTKSAFPQIYHRAARLYPNAPFLKHSPKNLTTYFLAQENRHMFCLAPQLNALQEIWRSNMAKFKQLQIQVPWSAKEDIHWLADRIPLNTYYLLIGEYHDEPNIKNKVAQLLRELRLKQPEREIILFTEFLPEYKQRDHWLIKDYAPEVRNAADENDIPIIGLEPNFVSTFEKHETSIHYYSDEDPVMYTEGKTNIWRSLEGKRLRDNYWLTIMQELRQEHPDALFVVYAGDAHIRGWEPFSLTSQLRGRNTFTVSFIPQNEITWFDDVTEELFSDARVLSFRDKHLRQLFGADVQIRVE
ncbi:MAG: hypothetical protein IKP06_04280 [Elusimicrobiaceae bacterium]|nr:hypothetical protein [Elusimicrobiaceae bacterium]